MKALSFRWEFGLDDAGHEVDAQDRTDHAERVCDGVPDGGVLALDDVERSLESRGARHRASIDAQCVSDFYPVDVAQTERNEQARNTCDECQQIVFLTHPYHALEKLP